MEIEKTSTSDNYPYAYKKCPLGQKITQEENGKQHSDSLNGNFKLIKELNLNPECMTLKDLIDGLYKIFESDQVNVEEVYSLMAAYKSNPAEWLKYAKFDKFRYTRNLVDAGNGKFNLMVLCWGEGHGSSIHDHANAHCFMKILAGDLCEVRFEWPEENPNESDPSAPCMKEISRTRLPTNGVCYINDSLGLHRVENLSYSDCAVSLHLYCPPFQACKVFNERTGQSIKAPVIFWSVYGKRNKEKQTQNIVPEDN